MQVELLSDPDWLVYIEMRQQRVTELVAAIRAAMPAEMRLAVIPTVQRPTAACWTEGSDLKTLSEVADHLEIPFYEPNANRAIADAWESLRQVSNPNKIRAILRPGLPDLNQGNEIAAAMAGIEALGIRDFAFYNYGLLPQHRLDLLAQSLIAARCQRHTRKLIEITTQICIQQSSITKDSTMAKKHPHHWRVWRYRARALPSIRQCW